MYLQPVFIWKCPIYKIFGRVGLVKFLIKIRVLFLCRNSGEKFASNKVS